MLTKRIILIPLILGLVVQIATAWDSFFFHSDEYFQIIEFASYKYHIGPANVLPWEFAAKIRPTFQVHLFGVFYECLTTIGIRDRFVIVSLLYVLIGIAFFLVSNYLVINKFREHKYLPHLLWLNNFFWLIPYLRCKYSAEAMGAFFWIVGVIAFEKLLARKAKKADNVLLFLTGIIFSLSFYCRFQIIFALLGLAIWFILKPGDKWNKATLVLAGFLAGIAFNIYLDRLFYDEWVFTPYRYFYANIIEGKANSFGTSPWWTYIVILMLIGLPLGSLLLFAFFSKGLTLYRNPFALGSLFFIIGHSIIGHKEERFIFPIVLIMVYLAAEAYKSSPVWVQKARSLWKNRYIGWFIRGGTWFSGGLNVFLVLLLSFQSYKQPVLFIKELNAGLQKNDHIVSFKQSPYETESGLKYAFLSENKYDSNIEVIRDKNKFIQALQQHPEYKYCILLSDAKENNLTSLLPKKHGIVASSFIWNTGVLMAQKFGIIIPDLWICQAYTEVKGE